MSLCCFPPFVPVMQSADSRQRNNLSIIGWLVFNGTVVRSVLVHIVVAAVLMIIRNIISKQSAKIDLTPWNAPRVYAMKIDRYFSELYDFLSKTALSGLIILMDQGESSSTPCSTLLQCSKRRLYALNDAISPLFSIDVPYVLRSQCGGQEFDPPQVHHWSSLKTINLTVFHESAFRCVPSTFGLNTSCILGTFLALCIPRLLRRSGILL